MNGLRSTAAGARQRGVTLIVGLIMLILITLMVTTAFTLNTSNLKSVGNMQFRNEALAAANKAMEQIVSQQFVTGFVTLPAQQTITYDINNDGNTDYKVVVSAPTCVQAFQLPVATSTGGCTGARAGAALAGCPKGNYSTLWDMTASVSDTISGAAIAVRQGMRIEITETQRYAVCP
jgi:Tfp pilus assembly protein PilX